MTRPSAVEKPVAGSLLLGIDIGTSSTKGVICTVAGDILASTVVEHDTSFPRPGWVEHDADALWWHDVVAVTRELTGGTISGADVGAVGISGIGPCMLPVDAAGTPLRPGILYGIDTRAGAEIDLLHQQLGEDAILDLSGMALNSQTIGPKILWHRLHEPDLFARTAMIHASSSYVVYRLTGEHVIDRHTASYFAPLFNRVTGDWDDRYADAVIGLDKLPRIGDATDVAGTITSAASAETGLPVGTPVVIGTIDAAAEAVSVGIRHPGDTMIMYGSTMFFINTVADPQPDRRMWTTAHALPNLRAVTAGLQTGGMLTTWFLEVTAGKARLAEHRQTFETLIESASATPPGAEGLICLPWFQGERTPLQDPDARGAYIGLSLRHTTAHLFRALLEGTAFGARHNFEVMAEMGAPPRRLVAVGGGTQNPLWLQVISDVTGLPQQVPSQTIGASYGDAFMAGLGSGLIPSLDAIDQEWVHIDRTVEPNPAVKPLYDDLFGMYLDLYPRNRDIMHRLAALNGSHPTAS
jgi:xylulokinase